MTHKRHAHLLFVIFLLSATVYSQRSVLRFNPHGTLKIAQFADLHFGEGEAVAWGSEQDINSTRVMRNVLASESPDFVVYTGDQITGNNIETNATKYWAEAVKPCVEGGYEWSVIFGNHDDMPLDKPITKRSPPSHALWRRELMAFDRTYSGSRSQFGPSSIHGVSNYFIPVYSADADPLSSKPTLMLYFLDSGGGQLDEIIYPDQVEWFQNITNTITQKYGPIPALAFFHIPCEEYSYAYVKDQCFGTNLGDGITPQTSDTGIFAIFQRANVKATFVGHDHGIEWCCPTKQGVELCFGRHTGYGGYGSWDRGARMIQVSMDKESNLSAESWVRMENGNVISRGTFSML